MAICVYLLNGYHIHNFCCKLMQILKNLARQKSNSSTWEANCMHSGQITFTSKVKGCLKKVHSISYDGNSTRAVQSKNVKTKSRWSSGVLFGSQTLEPQWNYGMQVYAGRFANFFKKQTANFVAGAREEFPPQFKPWAAALLCPIPLSKQFIPIPQPHDHVCQILITYMYRCVSHIRIALVSEEWRHDTLSTKPSQHPQHLGHHHSILTIWIYLGHHHGILNVDLFRTPSRHPHYLILFGSIWDTITASSMWIYLGHHHGILTIWYYLDLLGTPSRHPQCGSI